MSVYYNINPFDKKMNERLAALAARLGKHDVTIREYTYLLGFPDTNPKIAYAALAKAHAEKGEAESAIEYAQKLLEVDPGNSEAKQILKRFGKQRAAE